MSDTGTASKLRCVVSRLIAAGDIRAEDPAACVVGVLVKQHPEYGRKPQAALRNMVRDALSEGSINDTDVSATGKRTIETCVVNVSGGDSGVAKAVASMNDGLRGTYSALQGSALASSTSSRQGDGSASAARSSKKRRVHGTAPEEVVASVDPVAASRRLAPQVSLNEYVGYAGAVTRVREAVVDQLSARESYAALGVDGPRGVLVHGPPGCGKTLLCRATAGSAAIALAAEGGGELSYFELSGGDLGSGPEAEMNLERLLSAATTAAPSLVFLDDLDVLIGCGGGGGVSNGSESLHARRLAQCRMFRMFLSLGQFHLIINAPEGFTSFPSSPNLEDLPPPRMISKVDVARILIGLKDSRAWASQRIP